jgi:hypothetical protein
MPCDRIKLDGQPLQTVIVCSRGRARRCGFCYLQGGLQCDWKVSKTKTCDAFICVEHALEVDKGKHLCPAHQEAYKAWLARRAEKAKA